MRSPAHPDVSALWWLARLWVLAASILLAPAWAQTAPATGTAEATLEVAHRPVATFRSHYNGADPAARVARAETRLDEARRRELPPAVEMVPVTLEKQRGVAFRQGDVLLFTLTEADLEPDAGDTLEGAAKRALANLREALKAEAEQRQWPVILKALGVAAAETLLMALLLWGLWRLSSTLEQALGLRLENDEDSNPRTARTWLQYAQGLLSRLVQLATLFLSAALLLLLGHLGATGLSGHARPGRAARRPVSGDGRGAGRRRAARHSGTGRGGGDRAAGAGRGGGVQRGVPGRGPAQPGRQLHPPRNRSRHAAAGGAGHLGAGRGGGLPVPAGLQQRRVQGRVGAAGAP
jgi:hypothetical protein